MAPLCCQGKGRDRDRIRVEDQYHRGWVAVLAVAPKTASAGRRRGRCHGGFAAGNSVDIWDAYSHACRLLGQQVIIENIGAAGGILLRVAGSTLTACEFVPAISALTPRPDALSKHSTIPLPTSRRRAVANSLLC